MGPRQLHEAEVAFGTFNLADYMFAQPSVGGEGYKNTIASLLTLVNGLAPLTGYANQTALLANTNLGINFCAFVLDATANPRVRHGWAVYSYNGGDRTLLTSYTLLFQKGNKHYRGNWDASGGAMPLDAAAIGSGDSGAIQEGDEVRLSVAGNIGGEDWPVGTIGKALQNSPTLASHWRLY
jgi:hypothetical protein